MLAGPSHSARVRAGFCHSAARNYAPGSLLPYARFWPRPGRGHAWVLPPHFEAASAPRDRPAGMERIVSDALVPLGGKYCSSSKAVWAMRRLPAPQQPVDARLRRRPPRLAPIPASRCRPAAPRRVSRRAIWSADRIWRGDDPRHRARDWQLVLIIGMPGSSVRLGTAMMAAFVVGLLLSKCVTIVPFFGDDPLVESRQVLPGGGRYRVCSALIVGTYFALL